MNKASSLECFQSKYCHEMLHLESSTQNTDISDIRNSNRNQFEIQTPPLQTKFKLGNEKLIQRTSSVSFLKQGSSQVIFQLFGTFLALDSSEKKQTQQILEGWIRSQEIDSLKETQIKMIVYSELSKRSMEFDDLLESAISQYADIKMDQIQEKECMFQRQLD